MIKTIRSARDAGSSRNTAGAFTLVELLVVVAIIGLLIGLLLPSIGNAILLARRSKCSTTIKDLVGACIQYANDGTYHRESVRQVFPAVKVLPADWYKVGQNTADPNNPPYGNSGCLWLLLQGKFTSRNGLLCEGARVAGLAREINKNDVGFTTETVSYGYLSMTQGTNANGGEFYKDETKFPERTASNLSTNMGLIGDRNPRCTVGSSTVDVADTTTVRNSPNHGGKGQNVGRMDNSADWLTTTRMSFNFANYDGSTISENNDIYLPDWGTTTESAKLSTGMRSDLRDTLLLP